MKKEVKQKKPRRTLNRKKGQCCAPSRTASKAPSKNEKEKSLKVKWRRLISEGETCPRCGSTETEVDKAVSALGRTLAPLGIKVSLEKEELSVSEFQKDPLQSNRILINGRLLEDWLEGAAGHSPCCDVCGPSECRTLEVEGKTYEAVPAELIIKAGLIAASELIG